MLCFRDTYLYLYVSKTEQLMRRYTDPPKLLILSTYLHARPGIYARMLSQEELALRCSRHAVPVIYRYGILFQHKLVCLGRGFQVRDNCVCHLVLAVESYQVTVQYADCAHPLRKTEKQLSSRAPPGCQETCLQQIS